MCVGGFLMLLSCGIYPYPEALSEAGGFPCGYGWVSARVAGLGEPESASPWETTPYEKGLEKRRKKTNLKKLKCRVLNFLAPVLFSPTQYRSPPTLKKSLLPLYHTQVKVQTLC